ncbi:MAG: hypothetical protein SH817_09975 [Leptospira sp.]|nr:hypothetical protein [Leptospira sp.]
MKYGLSLDGDVFEEYDTYEEADEAMESNLEEDRGNWEIKKEKEDRYTKEGLEEVEVYNIYDTVGDGALEKTFDTLEKCEEWIENEVSHYEVVGMKETADGSEPEIVHLDQYMTKDSKSNVIDYFNERYEAEWAITEYEERDKKNGSFTENAYKISYNC